MDILNNTGLLLDIALIIISLLGLYLSSVYFKLAEKIKRMPIEDTYIGNLKDNQHGGVLEKRGMVRAKDGKGVIADSRPSNTFIESIING